MLEEEFDALVIQDVAVLDGVRAHADRGLHGLGVGRVRHHLEFALLADVERRLELVLQQERVLVQVPCRTHDPAGQVQLDVVDAVLDLLADRLHPAVRAIDLDGMTGSEEVSAGGREEMPRGIEARAEVLARVVRALPGHVHVVVRARAAQADDPRLHQRLRHLVAEERHLVRQRHVGKRREVIRVDVHVPQARHQVGALEVEDLGVG